MCTSGFAQTIAGKVVDQNTNEPLVGASVYIDGSTIGVMTDFEGHFELKIPNSINAALIVSFLGYSTKLYDLNEFGPNAIVYLEPKEQQLEEVFLGLDVWSRAKKERYFIRQFLGNTSQTAHCSIENIEDIELFHNSNTNTLSAYSEKPLIIVNKFLGYRIQYELIDFEIEFEYTLSNLLVVRKVYFAGTTFFSELKRQPKKKYLANRALTYDGSLLHFMRALAAQQLTEQGFEIFYDKYPIYPYAYFDISKKGELTRVAMGVEKIAILYDKTRQSGMELDQVEQSVFTIDTFGNHAPTSALNFSGDFGEQRVSTLLPLNYAME